MQIYEYVKPVGTDINLLYLPTQFIIFRCNIPVVLKAIREGVGYVKTQQSCILLYHADDDMFRPLWAIFRSQKCI